MDLHGSAAGVREDVGDALELEGFDEDVGAFARFVGGEAGRWRGREGGCGEGFGGDFGGNFEEFLGRDWEGLRRGEGFGEWREEVGGGGV